MKDKGRIPVPVVIRAQDTVPKRPEKYLRNTNEGTVVLGFLEKSPRSLR